jgi:uncharacterized protein YdhG (YjbR/CyaY superfamily)
MNTASKKTSGKRPSPYGPVKFTSIDEYHASHEGLIREALEEMRKLIKRAAPYAEEVISYNMPALKQNKVLVYYAAGKEHLGFYPTPSPILHFEEDLKKYETSKGAIQFPLDKKLPSTLIKKIVKFRMKEDKASLMQRSK